MLREALLVAVIVGCVEGNCRGLDRSALIKLYEALDGANWINNKNWNTTSGTSAENKANDPCDSSQRWFGVGFMDPCRKYLDDIVGTGPETDRLTQIRGAGQGCFAGRITSINLRRNNLAGNFSIPELGDLHNLTYVDLSWNSLGGSVPTQIGQIRNIQVLNLAHNHLLGSLPTELGNLNALGPPASSGCGIDDPCPMGVQLKMTDLSIGHNSLSGAIPSEIGNLVHLRILDLTKNNFSGAVPVQLGQLTSLQVLYLRENLLSGSLPTGFFQNMSELRYIMIQENSLSGAIPTQVGNLVKLNELHAHSNKFDAPLPDEIGDMTIVRDIRLQDNAITGPIPPTIGKLAQLRYLDLYNNQMTGDVPASIKNLTNLKTLYLQNEHLTPVRQRYCRQRIPNVGKFSWRMMREEYDQMVSVACPEMHDVEFTFNSLQASSSYMDASS